MRFGWVPGDRGLSLIGGHVEGVLVVDCCLRDGAGGSPTAVVLDAEALSDADLRRIPARLGVSHLAAVTTCTGQDPVVRFFTREGELPGCGHGTVAVITALILAGPTDGPRPSRLRIAGKAVEVSGAVTGQAADGDAVVTAWFEQGLISRRDPTDDELDAFLDAVGVDRTMQAAGRSAVIASPGRERLLLPVTDVALLARLSPDMTALAAASRRFGQLGCLVYVPPPPSGRAAARMFAPAIGVPEDIANANSTGCLAAVLLMDGHDPDIALDQGDALARPSTVHATARRTGHGFAARVGGIGALHRN
jgi:trans-2,3-dihydro-3-hydroxyanthranilate isomerase